MKFNPDITKQGLEIHFPLFAQVVIVFKSAVKVDWASPMSLTLIEREEPSAKSLIIDLLLYV
jgi:hypothetical protein